MFSRCCRLLVSEDLIISLFSTLGTFANSRPLPPPFTRVARLGLSSLLPPLVFGPGLISIPSTVSNRNRNNPKLNDTEKESNPCFDEKMSLGFLVLG